jgi:hypothetical protein
VRALTVIVAPLLYANVYATFAPKGKPGYVFYVAAVIVAFAEMLHRSITDDQCRPALKASVSTTSKKE